LKVQHVPSKLHVVLKADEVTRVAPSFPHHKNLHKPFVLKTHQQLQIAAVGRSLRLRNALTYTFKAHTKYCSVNTRTCLPQTCAGAADEVVEAQVAEAEVYEAEFVLPMAPTAEPTLALEGQPSSTTAQATPATHTEPQAAAGRRGC